MEFNPSNILYLIAYIAPLLVLSLVVLVGLLNGNIISSSIFVVLMLVLYVIGHLMQKGLNIVSTSPKHAVCSVFGQNLYMSPSMSSMMLIASIIYLCMPFIIKGQPVVYVPLVSVLTIVWIIDFTIKVKNNCTNNLGVFMGSLVGAILGGLVTTLLYNFMPKGLLMNQVLESNNQVCSKPTDTKFKCSVYKNGQLITST